jgi:hypothetical protein
MNALDLDAYVSRYAAVDVSDLPWEDVPKYLLSPDALRTLRYMQDIESHTIVYLRELLSTRAIDDPAVATFLACWIYEETFHGRALARFLAAAGEAVVSRPRSQTSLAARLQHAGTALASKVWPGFIGVHMVWGAINELTTLTGYKRLAAVAGHPILAELLGRIMRDESRHFAFYFQQAQHRLATPRVARIARLLVDRFWAPVGSGVQPADETRFLARYLFAGPDGAQAARKVDDTIRRLPGFSDACLLESWIGRHESGSAAGRQRLPLDRHEYTGSGVSCPQRIPSGVLSSA